MGIPAFGTLIALAQLVLHVPRIGEGANIHPPEVDPAASEAILVVQGHPQGAVSAHAQARDGTSSRAGMVG